MGKKKAFVIISFSEEFENVFNFAIKPAVEEAGLIAEKADGKDKAIRDIYKDIAEKLVLAELVIVDISKVEDKEGNIISLDNVYYELGLAHGINKRVIFLTQDADNDIPYDLKKLEAITYNSNKLQNLQIVLKEKIPQALNDEPIKFFEDIEIINKEDKKDKVVKEDNNGHIQQKILNALNDLHNKREINSKIKLKLIGLSYIEVKYIPSEGGPKIDIEITEKGAKFLINNMSLLNK